MMFNWFDMFVIANMLTPEQYQEITDAIYEM